MKRIVIYPSDIMLLTGKSESYARKGIQNIKKVLNKEKHHKVTVREFCDYFGLDFDEVTAVLSKFEIKNAS